MAYYIATDTGGTFTDVAAYDTARRQVRYGKTLTTYGNLVDGVLDGIDMASTPLAEASILKHGTTVVINTFIQRSGARTALVTTAGFRDVLEIARTNRPVPFVLDYRRDPPLVPRNLRFEVDERIGAQGEVLRALDRAEVERLAARLRALEIDAVAVSFMNAYVNPVHEKQAVDVLRSCLPGAYVVAGTALSREWFEYERTSTAVANAYVGARMGPYIDGFGERLRERGFRGTFYMMGSNGGVLSAERATEQPVMLVESGPIGGCIGTAAYARALGMRNVIAFDMGGTTAKCALVLDGQFQVQPVYYVNGYEYGFPLRAPVLDIVEVGAGGGSIASVDASGRLSVGPRSAGSEPGPVAFGRGGVEPTVTDANLVLGRIGAGNFLRGRLRLDAQAAADSIRERVARPLGYSAESALDRAAQGILDLAAAKMSSAIKEITIERGHDVRTFSLFAFGGGGPLFGSILGRSLHIPEIVVPPHPGNFSTIGMLLSGARLDLSRTIVAVAESGVLATLRAAFDELEQSARRTIRAELATGDIAFEHALDMRYRGQTHTVRVPCGASGGLEPIVAAFEDTYRRQYGKTNPGCAIEILAVRLGAQAKVPRPALADLAPESASAAPEPSARRAVYFPAPHGRREVPVWRRDQMPAGFELHGPAVIEEFSATTVLLPGDLARVGALGELRIRCA